MSKKNIEFEIPLSELTNLSGKTESHMFALIHVRHGGGLEQKEILESTEPSEILILHPEFPFPFLAQDDNLNKNLQIFLSRVSISSHHVIGCGGVWNINDIFGLESKSHNPTMESRRRLSANSIEIAQSCSICMTEIKNIILLPCRHFCVCHQCFDKIDKCPVCRSAIISFVRYEKEINTKKTNIDLTGDPVSGAASEAVMENSRAVVY